MGEKVQVAAKKPEVKRENQASHTRNADRSQSMSSPVDQVLYLQRTIGNQAVQRLIKSGALQAKLRIGQPRDKYEEEADRMADAVMRMPEPQLQRQPEEEEEEEDLIQTKPLTEQITPLVQRQVEPEEEEEILQTKESSKQSPAVSSNLETNIQSLKTEGTHLLESIRAFFEPRFGHDFSKVKLHTNTRAAELARTEITPLMQRQESLGEVKDEELIQTKIARDVTPEVTPAINSGIQSLQSGGRPLSGSERSFFEPRFGADFSNVRVHNDTRAANVARSVNARAFTFGHNVVFGTGEYSSDSLAGRNLLAHELTHVVQQSNERYIIRRWWDEEDGGHWEVCDHQVNGGCQEAINERYRRGAIIYDRLMHAGVEEGNVGVLDALRDWEPVDLRRYYTLLMEVRAGAIGVVTRIIRAWNGNLDSLRNNYPTILHYVQDMDTLSRNTMGLGWVQAARYMERHSAPIIAGVMGRVQVHPRALYFVSAAQIGMNLEAEQLGPYWGARYGHYVAPGAFRDQLRDIYNQAGLLAGGVSIPMRSRRQGGPTSQPIRGGSIIYSDLISRLQMISDALSAQAEGRSFGPYRPDEHREPALRAFFTDDHRRRITQLAEEGSASDSEAQERANVIVSILEGVGGVHRAHGAYAVDPHGREHGIGLAIDLFNLAHEREQDIPREVRRYLQRNVTNNAPPSSFWIVLPSLLAGLPEGSEFAELENVVWGGRPSMIRLTVDQALLLARLLRSEHVREWLVSQESTGEPSQPEESGAAILQELTSIRRAINSELRERLNMNQGSWQVMFRNHLRYGTDSGAELERQFNECRERMRSLQRSLQRLSPREMGENLGETNEMLRHFAAVIQNLEVGDVRAIGRASPEQILANLQRWAPRFGPGPQQTAETEESAAETEESERTLSELHQWFSDDERLQAVETAWHRSAWRSRIRGGSAQRQIRELIGWLRVMSDPGIQADIDLPLYDQPRVMIRGIDQVSRDVEMFDENMRQREGRLAGYRRSRFEGGHHWEVQDVNILTDDLAYQRAIEADMSNRTLDQMRQILAHMIQTPEGRLRVLGAPAGETRGQTSRLAAEHPDPQLRRALTRVHSTTVESLLPESSVEREPSGGGVSSFVRSLQQRGLYNLARQLQQAQTGSSTEE